MSQVIWQRDAVASHAPLCGLTLKVLSPFAATNALVCGGRWTCRLKVLSHRPGLARHDASRRRTSPYCSAMHLKKIQCEAATRQRAAPRRNVLCRERTLTTVTKLHSYDYSASYNSVCVFSTSMSSSSSSATSILSLIHISEPTRPY